ncbi:MAG TPA: tetratricopeptide repeat protein [Thermoanaerobaculia bacterium]|nr:tetratricopeptide repeat protein [Thermoanaerobaculia bacterium]
MRALLLLLAALPALAQPSLAQETPAEKPPLRVLRTGGLRVETAALLMSGQEGGTIPVAALAIPLPGAGGKARVAVLLEMDGAEAMEGQSGDLLRLEICLYALTSAPDGSGRVAGSRMDTVEIDLARLGADLEKSGLKYMGELQLAPGEYALRTLVRNAATSEVGLRMLPLSVPDFGQSQNILLPPLVAEPAGAWLQARGAGIASPPPGLSFEALPSARPVFSPTQEISLRVPAWKLGGIGGGELQIEVRRPGGARVATFPLKIASREESGTAGLELLTATVQLKDVEEGVYELGIASASRGSDESALATPFVLLEQGGGGQVWAALTAPRRSRTAAAGAPAQAPRAATKARRTRKIDAGPVRDSYRAVLRRLVEGDRNGARDAMLELQTKVLTGDRPAVSDDLVEVELDVAAELAREDLESLVPVLTLHQVLYREAVRKAGFLLSTHNRELIFRLVDLYAERSGSPEGKRRASRFLMGLAAEMVWTAPPSLRARVFQQILAYDSRQEAAILCLAVDAERQGRYGDAVGYLERLPPGHTESRLRLAVNLARLGKMQEARKLLRELSAPAAKAEAWQLAVAWQEMARLQLAAGDLDGAEQTLREGLQRLPEDDKLALQLGLVRDLRKDPRGARDAVADLGKTPGAGGAARHRYNQLPLESLDQAWIELQEQGVGQIPALAAVLGVSAAIDEAPRNTP